MTRIAVEKTNAVSADRQALMVQIRELAYHLFESRGGGDGHDLDDWLAAERELVSMPVSEVAEKDGKFEIRVPAAGYQARDIHVTALPASLVVKAAAENRAGHKTMFGTIELPELIDVDRTTATLDHGTLLVTAVRQGRKREPASA